MKKTIPPNAGIAVFEEYYRAKMSRKAYGQLVRAAQQRRDAMWQNHLLQWAVIDPDGEQVFTAGLLPEDQQDIVQFLSDADNIPVALSDRPGYMCFSSYKGVKGRSQHTTLGIMDAFDFRKKELIDRRDSLSFFTGFMRFGVQEDATWNSPRLRCMLGPLTVITIEIDPSSELTKPEKIKVLDTQLGWLRKSGSSEKSMAINALWLWLCQFSDFRGIVAVYSGNKSIHFHILFDTRELMTNRPDLRDRFRPAYQAAYDRVSAAFAKRLPLDAAHDGSMRLPEQFRRLPNGTCFVASQTDHIFDVPEGMTVPQLVLYEKLLNKAPNGADRFMFDGTEVGRLASETVSVRPARKATGPHVVFGHPDQHQYCSDRLAALTSERTGPDGYPRLARLELGHPAKAFFLADETDQNPNVLMFGNQDRTVTCGGREPKQHIAIPFPLDHYISHWCDQWATENADLIGSDDEAIPSDQPFGDRMDFTQLVQRNQREIADRMKTAIDHSDVVLMQGPEGLGKTTAAMQLIPALAKKQSLHRLGPHLDGHPSYRQPMIEKRCSAVSTLSYDQAVAKCEQYNAMHKSEDSIGIVFHSFNHVYDQALEQVFGNDWKDHKINLSIAGSQGARSVRIAIETKQPSVWARMAEIHKAMLAQKQSAPTGCHVVLFMVHAVMHQWTEEGLSRLFSSQNFFSTPTEDLWKLKDETELAVAVQDELNRGDFIQVELQSVVRWCEGLFASDQVWEEDFLDAAAAQMSWQNYSRNSVGAVSFETVTAIWRSGIQSECFVTVRACERYGTYDNTGLQWPMFKARNGTDYAYRKRDLWMSLADKVLLLTTEALVTELFRATASGTGSVSVCDCTDLKISSGEIELHVLNSLKAAENETTAVEFRKLYRNPDIHVVCNSPGELDHTTSFVKAKGSNDLSDKDILQIANFISPGENGSKSEYDELQIINQVYGLRNAIRLHHIDTINQTAGRNLGYRSRGCRHHLLMSKALWQILSSDAEVQLRYPVATIQSSLVRRDNKNNTHKMDLIQGKRTAQEETDMRAEIEAAKQEFMRRESELDLLSIEEQMLFEENDAA